MPNLKETFPNIWLDRNVVNKQCLFIRFKTTWFIWQGAYISTITECNWNELSHYYKYNSWCFLMLLLSLLIYRIFLDDWLLYIFASSLSSGCSKEQRISGYYNPSFTFNLRHSQIICVFSILITILFTFSYIILGTLPNKKR